MNHYLFLDFDGVINTHRSLYKRLAGYYDIPYTDEDFSEDYWGQTDGVNPLLIRKIEDLSKTDEYKPAKVSFHYYPFDNLCIDNCNRIIKENHAEVVITSTWRYRRSVEDLQEILDSIGLYGTIIGKTERLHTTRAEEIYKWIKTHEEENNTKVESICILDDEHAIDIDYMLGDYTVKDISTVRHGLRQVHIQEAKEVFNKQFDINNIKID